MLAKLRAPVVDAWVSTADGGMPYLVPLTVSWYEERLVLATSRRSPTARNLLATGRARVALGQTRDVVMIEAVLQDADDDVLATADPAAAAVGEAYAAQNDWDPRTAGPDYVFVRLTPLLIQAWREQNEIADRTLMRDGVWLD